MKYYHDNLYSVSKDAFMVSEFHQKYAEENIVKNDMIIICVEGMAKVEINGSEILLTRNCCEILHIGNKIEVMSYSNDFRAVGIGIGASVMAVVRLELPSEVCGNSLNLIHAKLPDTTCKYMIEMVTSVYEDKENIHYLRLMINCIRQILLNINNYMYEKPEKLPSTNRHASELCFRFAVLLADNHKQRRDVRFYADSLNVSPQYLNILTRRYTGYSAKESIDIFIVSALRVAFHSPVKSLKEITDDFNFPDVSYLCRYFKKLSGTTPNGYRNIYTAKHIAEIVNRQYQLQEESETNNNGGGGF